MRNLYTIGILLYGFAIRVAGLFNEKARQWVLGRKDVFNTIQNANFSTSHTIWFHASSLGEFEQARPIIDLIKEQYSQYKIVVTFFSPSGYEIRKNYPNADYVFYLPLDTPRNAYKFLNIIKPKLAFFVKYDFWFNYLNELGKLNIPTFLFSSIFRSNQYFFKFYGKWFSNQLQAFTHLFVQNQESEKLLHSIGIMKCSIAGDTRFDQVIKIVASARAYKEVENFIAGQNVLLVGSSWEPDEILIKNFENRYTSKPLKLIIAPHQIYTSHIQHIQQLFGDTCIKYSELSNVDASHYKILIIDNIGMLSSLYQYAHVAYIGGGFGKGIHNILEAVAFGKPICFGPNYKKFQEAKDMIDLGGGISITDGDSLYTTLENWFNNDELYYKASQSCMQYVNANCGTSNIIMQFVKSYI